MGPAMSSASEPPPPVFSSAPAALGGDSVARSGDAAGVRGGEAFSGTSPPAKTPDERSGTAPAPPRTATLAALALLLAPTALSVTLDFTRRGRSLLGLGMVDWARYLSTWSLSVALLGALLVTTLHPRRVARVAAGSSFFLLFSVCIGTQSYFRAQTASYFNLDAALFGAAFAKTVVDELWRDLPAVVSAHLPAAALASALLLAAALWRRRVLSPMAPGRSALPLPWTLLWPAPALALVVLSVAPIAYRGSQAALPEVLALHAVVGMGMTRASGTATNATQTLPGKRSPEYLPTLLARPEKARNIVLIVTESVRADVFCSAFAEDCPTTPRTNAAAPDRLPLLQMRATDSATAVSVAVLLTGLPPSASREDMHRSPTLWEYAAAAGWDTAYWTSQNLSFANSDVWVRDIGVDKRVSALELDPHADLDLGANDSDLSAYVQTHLATLHEPFFVVLHLANTHFPYRNEEDTQPFAPAEFTKDPAKNDAFFNYYKNAVALQDRAIGEMVSAVRAMPSSERTVIAFTSDHGEAFREHGQIGHTLSIFDEEIHVPAFVDAPPGTLGESERAALVASRNRPVFHTDLAPTMLDLMGLWTAPELTRGRGRMVGSSLLRAPSTGPRATSVPLTNCAAVWGCPFKNWGMMRGKFKLEARQWDDHWHCYDVIADPHERSSLGLDPPECADLATAAEHLFGGLPGRKETP
jgi:phosphoglycerol transferase MdoB-like AlkP superfamily enzyme